ncbi:MAG TPA: hypothetical protein DEA59_05095, partial [Microbacterium sp.]|nr:hypothetical protein [Microbacterium sp.]
LPDPAQPAPQEILESRALLFIQRGEQTVLVAHVCTERVVDHATAGGRERDDPPSPVRFARA